MTNKFGGLREMESGAKMKKRKRKRENRALFMSSHDIYKLAHDYALSLRQSFLLARLMTECFRETDKVTNFNIH